MGNLSQELGFLDISLATSGYIIGAGIYAIIGIASKYGKKYTWISVIISGIIAICTGLSYAELASMFEKNNSIYLYTKEAFNDHIATFMRYTSLFGEITALSTVALGLGQYISSIINVKQKLISIILIISMGYLNYSGIRNTANFNNTSTIIEISGLLAIILFGMKYVGKKTFDVSSLNMDSIYPILVGTSVINIAYIGYDVIIHLSEETKNPKYNIPYGMMSGILLTIVLYSLVTLVAISSIGWKALSSSKAPIADVARHILGSTGGKIIFFIATISMLNTLLMGNVGASRLLHSIIEDSPTKLPFNLTEVDKETNTPYKSIFMVTLCSVLVLFCGNLEKVTSYTNISTLLIFIIVNIAVVKMRLTKPIDKSKFNIPFNIYNVPVSAIIGSVLSIFFTYLTIAHNIKI